jgi:hypothetical protein
MYRDPRHVTRDRIIDCEVKKLELRQARMRQDQPSGRRHTADGAVEFVLQLGPDRAA